MLTWTFYKYHRIKTYCTLKWILVCMHIYVRFSQK